MSTIGTERPVFPPAPKGAGTTSVVPPSATKILREAQAAFFRPAAHTVTAPEPVAQPVVAQEPAPADRAMMRPGTYLNILV